MEQDANTRAGMFAELERIPEQVRRVLHMSDEIARAAERYRYMRVCVVIGRGYNYATAFETALKIKELSYVLAEPYSSVDFMHGPVALIEEDFPALVIAPSGVMEHESGDVYSHSQRTRGGSDCDQRCRADFATGADWFEIACDCPGMGIAAGEHCAGTIVCAAFGECARL